MLDLKVNKKMLQNHLSKKCGQVVLLKDLHNIGSSSKDSGLSGLEEAIDELKKIPGIDYLHESSCHFLCCTLKNGSVQITKKKTGLSYKTKSFVQVDMYTWVEQ